MFKKSFKKRGASFSLIMSIFIAYGLFAGFAGDKKTNEMKEGEKSDKCLMCHKKGEYTKAGLEERFKTEDCMECHSGYHKGSSKLPAGRNFDRNFGKIADTTTGKKEKTKFLGFTKEKPPARMVYIPAGKFIMGSDDRFPDEKPKHTAETNAYFIDINEITNKEYYDFTVKTNRQPPQHFIGGKVPKGKESHPVTFVDWFDAEAYCKFAGKRLPDEREWEKAARGTEGNNFPWGNDFDAKKGNVPQLALGHTMPVGSFPQGRSPYGLNDMSGNVWEWVDAYYLPHPGNNDEDENYGKQNRVLKGGSWVDCGFYKCGMSAFSFNRSFFLPETKNKGFGFRCAADAE